MYIRILGKMKPYVKSQFSVSSPPQAVVCVSTPRRYPQKISAQRENEEYLDSIVLLSCLGAVNSNVILTEATSLNCQLGHLRSIAAFLFLANAKAGFLESYFLHP